MKGDKIRVVLIYILILIIIFMVGYLVYNSVGVDKKVDKPSLDSDISEDCSFEMSLSEYNAMLGSDKSNLCGGMNKIIVKNISLNDEETEVEVRYYNGDQSDESGVYVFGKRIVKGAGPKNINRFGIFDNKLFILSIDDAESNITAYDSSLNKVYDLRSALASSDLSDPAFVELAKTNPTLETKVNNSNIGLFNFLPNEFTFSTDSKLQCVPGGVNGSKYRVVFNGDTFETPQFVEYSICQ